MLNSIWCLSVLLRLDMRWCEIRREPCFLNILWGASQSKTQYVSTSRAMSPNDLYVVGLPPGCGSNRPFERQMDSAGEVEKKKKRRRRAYLFLWKVRRAHGDLLANWRSRRLWEFSDWRWRNHVGYPARPKHSGEERLEVGCLGWNETFRKHGLLLLSMISWFNNNSRLPLMIKQS